MKKTEIIISILTFIAVILNYLLIPGGILLTVLTLSMLSCLYFGFSFILLNGIRFRNIFKRESYKGIGILKIIGTIGTGFSLSIAIIGLLFRVMFWPGSTINLLVGIVFLTLVSIICFIKIMMKSNQNYYSRILIRTGIVGVCCLIMFSFSSQQVHEFKYRNYPAYLEAEKQFHAEPDNQELLNKYEEERRKMEQGQ